MRPQLCFVGDDEDDILWDSNDTVETLMEECQLLKVATRGAATDRA